MFRDRPSAILALAAFKRWYNKFDTQRNLLLQTKRYSEDILVHRALRVWRWELRQKLKMSKDAKAARKYLLLKNGWLRWKMRVKEKEREKKVHAMELLLASKYFKRERPLDCSICELMGFISSIRMACEDDSRAESSTSSD